MLLRTLDDRTVVIQGDEEELRDLRKSIKWAIQAGDYTAYLISEDGPTPVVIICTEAE